MSNSKVKYPSLDHLKQRGKWWLSDLPGRENNYKWFIQEKIDGSQLSFQVADENIEFFCRGKQVDIHNDTFAKSIEMLTFLHESDHRFNREYIYHGESVCSCQHNVVAYERTPKYYFICYDIFDTKSSRYLDHQQMVEEATRVGLESVPLLYTNDDPLAIPYQKCQELINLIESNEIISVLGGRPEGVVVKHHQLVDAKDRVVASKHKLVSTAFKENHLHKRSAERKVVDPETFIKALGSEFATEPRFHKAYQHLKEESKLTGKKDKDFYLLIDELNYDFDKEYKKLIMNYLWSEFAPIIKKEARNGARQWFEAL